MCKKQTTNLTVLKLLTIKRLSWKPESLVWYSHGSRIDTEFGQSVPAVCYSTARLNTLKCNSRFWVNLWPSWQGAERRFGLDVAAAARCCEGMSSVRMCACGNKADLSFSSQLQPSTLLLHCLQLAMVLGFVASASSPTRSSVMWPGDVAGVTESPLGRRCTKCVA